LVLAELSFASQGRTRSTRSLPTTGPALGCADGVCPVPARGRPAAAPAGSHPASHCRRPRFPGRAATSPGHRL